MKEVWCAVGTLTGLRSTVWRIWTQGGSAYLRSRMMGNSTKVSLHPTGQAQFSMTSEWYGVNRPNQPNQRRHIEKWRWERPTGDAASHVLTLSIPSSELRLVSTDENLSRVGWLPDPGEEKRLDLRCFVVPRRPSAVAATRPDLAGGRGDPPRRCPNFARGAWRRPDLATGTVEGAGRGTQLSTHPILMAWPPFPRPAIFLGSPGSHLEWILGHASMLVTADTYSHVSPTWRRGRWKTLPATSAASKASRQGGAPESAPTCAPGVVRTLIHADSRAA